MGCRPPRGEPVAVARMLLDEPGPDQAAQLAPQCTLAYVTGLTKLGHAHRKLLGEREEYGKPNWVGESREPRWVDLIVYYSVHHCVAGQA